MVEFSCEFSMMVKQNSRLFTFSSLEALAKKEQWTNINSRQLVAGW